MRNYIRLKARCFAVCGYYLYRRITTVWYRSRGKDFDITNSTAFDQFFVEGREIFDSVSRVVDRIFNMFIRRLGRKEPFFSIYHNGTTATCCGMSQWGSQDLALRGYTPIQILRYYYPSDVDIFESNTFTNQMETFPGYSLKEGSTGEPVRTMQTYLNRISGNYYMQPVGRPDGIFGSSTKNSTTEFQRIFSLIPDGIIGKSTWYEITKIYVGVKQLAELTSEGKRIGIGQTPPTVTLSLGARGEYVVELQFLLNYISTFFPAVPFVVQNGVFQDPTKRAVTEFQAVFGLTPDGVVGPATWRKLYDVYHSIEDTVVTPPVSPDLPAFPGVALRVGSRGDDVRIMQERLNGIARYYPAIPTLTADGVFGPLTETAVKAFQRQFGLIQDGVIGQTTWYKVIDVYNNLTESGTPPTPEAPPFPGTALRIGSRGEDVRIMQSYLASIAKVFPVVPAITADGVFGSGTQSAVMAFQRFFGLTADGVIGQNTWNKIVSVYKNLPDVASPVFPGTALRNGSRGNDVIIMQKYLNALSARYPSIPSLTADGVFGAGTQAAVMAFQRQFGLTADGVIGQITWNQIVSRFNLMNSGIGAASVESVAAPVQGNNLGTMAALMMLMNMRR